MSDLAEYLRRNGVVARAYGAQAAVEQAAERAARLKRASADDYARRFEAAQRRQA